MFLSKVILDRWRRDVLLDLEDRDRLHKKVMRLFPEIPGGPCDNARQQLGVLYRVEDSTMLLQSLKPPQLPRGLFGYEISATKDVTGNFQAIRTHRTYRFRLDANTSFQVVEGDSHDWIPETEDGGLKVRQKTRRVGCGAWPARTRWFEGMCRRCGIVPESYFMESLSPVKVKEGFLEVTRFDGHLSVADLPMFMRTLSEGIGQGKSYGLGLLSLRNS
jgi:CRISPR system Cascade subunit CasE